MHSNFIAAVLILIGSPAILLSGTTTDVADQSVRVEIFELADKQKWPTESDVASESFGVAAMAVPFLPRRYSSQGLIVDRKPRFVVRVSADVFLEAGKHDLLLRAMNEARLMVDEKEIAATKFKLKYSDGHNTVPKLQKIAADIRTAAPGHAEQLASFSSPGKRHKVTVEAIVGGKNKRSEIGELSVSSRNTESDENAFEVLAASTNLRFKLTDDHWNARPTDVFAIECRAIARADRARYSARGASAARKPQCSSDR